MNNEGTPLTYLPAFDILHNLFLPLQRRHLSSIGIPIAFRQEQRNEMNPRPRLFSLKFPVTQ